MRTYRLGVAVLAAMLVTLALSSTASATATGITIIETPLVVQRGTLTFNTGVMAITCNTTLLKRLILGLTPVRPGLVRLGKVRAGRLAPECPNETAFLNLPAGLGDVPGDVSNGVR